MALVEKGGRVVKKEKDGKDGKDGKVKKVKEKKEKKEKKDQKEKKVDKVEEVVGEVKEVEDEVNGEEVVGKKKDKEKKKDKKDKKAQKQVDEGEEDEEQNEDKGAKNDEGTTPSKKRKRTLPEGELAIDITLPEPPSKKALRKLKKTTTTTDPNAPTPSTTSATTSTPQTHGIGATQNRSKYGVWIGNLSFTTTESQLREFFTSPGSTGEAGSKREVPPPPGLEVGRINLPTKKAWNKFSRKEELQNQGFAYVDFSIPEGLSWAVKYKSEMYLGSRKVLIKDANNFEGRPTKSEAASADAEAGRAVGGGGGGGAAVASRNPPSKILFVGNLPFETTDEEISKHFSFAGSIQKVRLARFEDSGKCKGFGFLDFTSIEEVERAMKGVSLDDPPMPGEDGVPVEGKEEVRLERERKKLRGDRRYFRGRLVRMEFGEDAEVRYKKRWGGKGKKGGERDGEEEDGERKRRRVDGEDGGERRSRRGGEEKAPRKKKEEVYGKGKDKAMVERMTGAAVQATGKKVTFD